MPSRSKPGHVSLAYDSSVKPSDAKRSHDAASSKSADLKLGIIDAYRNEVIRPKPPRPDYPWGIPPNGKPAFLEEVSKQILKDLNSIPGNKKNPE